MKKQPQTIADLKINYTFTDYVSDNDVISAKIERFSKDNKSLLKYKIKPQVYTFHINSLSFNFHVIGKKVSFPEFMEWLNFELVYNNIPTPIKLDRFELIAENTFRIHTK
jgi:hypothetical protein